MKTTDSSEERSSFRTSDYSISFPTLAPCTAKEPRWRPTDPGPGLPTPSTQLCGRAERHPGLLASFFLSIRPCLLRPLQME